VEHGSPSLVDSSPFGWFIQVLHFHPAGGVQKRLFTPILSLRRIVRGRSSHPPNGRSQVRPAAAVYLRLASARHETTPQVPGPLHRGEKARRQQERHDVEPDVARGDAARWVAVGNA
jgi:hypothetical protein